MYVFASNNRFFQYFYEYVKLKHQKVINAVFLSKFIKYETKSTCIDLHLRQLDNIEMVNLSNSPCLHVNNGQ